MARSKMAESGISESGIAESEMTETGTTETGTTENGMTESEMGPEEETMEARDQARMAGESGDREEAIGKARDAALHLLSFRARSVAEMERRLRKKDFEDSVVSQVVAWLLDLGYLDDREFARQFLDERLRRRPRGPFALVQELRKRGVDRHVAEEVLDALMKERDIDEGDLARDTARRWLSRQSRRVTRLLGQAETGEDSQESMKTKRRLYAHLERKGFSRGVIPGAVDAVLREIEER